MPNTDAQLIAGRIGVKKKLLHYYIKDLMHHQSLKMPFDNWGMRQKKKIKDRYARVVKWVTIKDNIPKKLKLLPVAMIPHKSKKYRCILDLSFTLHEKGKTFTSVNATTNKHTPTQAMSQLGHCLSWLVATMADNYNPKCPFMFTKLDIKTDFGKWKFQTWMPGIFATYYRRSTLTHTMMI